MWTVSYTHLDVYKRQLTLQCAAHLMGVLDIPVYQQVGRTASAAAIEASPALGALFPGIDIPVSYTHLKIPQWILALEPEDAAFLKNFVLKSGSLKEIAKLYEVSYPTVRLRLDRLIQKIEISDQKEEEPFSTFIKGLAVDARIDLETDVYKRQAPFER